jgi:hypothetical protein
MSEFVETNPTREQIEARAYEIYLSRGGDHGADVDDWLVAERELTGSVEGSIDSGTVDAQAPEQSGDEGEDALQDAEGNTRAFAAGAGS